MLLPFGPKALEANKETWEKICCEPASSQAQTQAAGAPPSKPAIGTTGRREKGELFFSEGKERTKLAPAKRAKGPPICFATNRKRNMRLPYMFLTELRASQFPPG
jgi:hypothetical protein